MFARVSSELNSDEIDLIGNERLPAVATRIGLLIVRNALPGYMLYEGRCLRCQVMLSVYDAGEDFLEQHAISALAALTS